MKRHLLTALLASLIGAATVSAQGANDQPQDVVFLAPMRPLVLRLHVEINGKPYHQIVDEWVKELFTFLDRDKNGTLDGAEAERAPKAPALAQRLRQGVTFSYTYQTTPLGEVDDNDDDKVTLEELTKYYRGSEMAQARLVAITPFAYSSDVVTEALINLFDKNKDGKLNAEEMGQAGEVLAKYDSNDDETLDISEVAPSSAPMTPRLANEGAMMGMGGPGAGPRSFFIPQGRLDLAQQMVSRYDVDQNGKLTPEEAGLEDVLFKRLDANTDGLLDGPELIKIVGKTPDLELLLRIGGSADKPPVEVLSPKKEDKQIKTKIANGGLTLTIGSAQLDLRSYGIPGSVNLSLQESQFAANLYPADPTSRGYVTRADVSKPQGRLLQPIFDVGDLNADGKLTANELLQLFQMDMKAAPCVVTLSAGETGRGLFQLMDSNQDGRLSLREMRRACDRVVGNKDGEINKAELPSQFNLAISLGASTYVRPVGQGTGTNPPPGKATAMGPLWFRKMDANTDGDVSRREWLGSLEDFKRLDTDADGMINPEEAGKAR